MSVKLLEASVEKHDTQSATKDVAMENNDLQVDSNHKQDQTWKKKWKRPLLFSKKKKRKRREEKG